MLKLLRTKIEELINKNQNSKEELLKLLRISSFSIKKISKSVSFLYNEYNDANDELLNIMESSATLDFNDIKNKILTILETIEAFEKNNPDVNDVSMQTIFYNAERKELDDKIEFALLMVEQNNLNYFKSKKYDFEDEPHERLHSHYMIVSDKNGYIINFNPNSPLPETIRNEVIEAFNQVFS